MKRIYNDLNLEKRNSFGVKQQAAMLVEFETADDLKELFEELKPTKWYVLGAGNNTLFTADYEGVLVTPVSSARTVLKDDGEVVDVRVEAAHDWDEFVAWSVENGLWGVENLSSIPSSVGAAPVQNIGAYGAEVKDAITVVEYFDVNKSEVVRLTCQECGFGYRESIFKHELRGVAIILAVEFRLHRTPSPKLGYGDVIKEVEARGGATLKNIREAICAIRASKLPDPKELGNAGSFFKNPIVPRIIAERLLNEYPSMPCYAVPNCDDLMKLAAGWLIEKCGWKGRTLGNAGVYPKQALVLFNNGGCTGAEVVALANAIEADVESRFGVRLEKEAIIIN
jgi:UDP-N-acetylmuramate dehydrogenase